jgi:hypothetical protein
MDLIEKYLTESKKLVTVEQLSDLLKKKGFIKNGFKLGKFDKEKGYTPIIGKGVSSEVYGRKAYLYIRFRDVEERAAAEDYLESIEDIKGIDRRYAKGYPIMAIQVKYFKGWHWDE